ncbi:hypothetical protein R6Q57_022864 [Mikania cordata]
MYVFSEISFYIGPFVACPMIFLGNYFPIYLFFSIFKVRVTCEIASNALTRMQHEIILPYHCKVCDISCNAKDMLMKHEQGKKHLKSLEKLTNSSTMAPKMVPPPISSETVVGETENKMHRLLQNGAAPDTLIYCDICNVICNNEEGFQKHVASKKHSAKSIVQLASTNAVFDVTSDPHGDSQKKSEPFQCEICQITCNSNEHLKLHIAGKKHLKKLQDLGQTPNLPLTPVASQGTPPTKPMENQQSNEGKIANSHKGKPVCELCKITCDTDEVFKIHLSGKKHLKKLKDSRKIPNLPLTPIVSQGTPVTNPTVNLESNEGKTVNLHEAKPVCELCGITCDTNEMLQIHIIGKKHQKNLEKSEILIGPNPAPSPEPVAEPKMIGPMQEKGKSVISDGNSRKKKRGGIDMDVEVKKQKVVQSGTSSDAVQTCKLCNVVCNSPTVLFSHLAGQKHAAMAVKQAETQARATCQES